MSKGFGSIKGSGGLFGGGPKKPVTQTQSKFTSAEISLIGCLGEGPIEGMYTPAHPLQSLFIDKVPVQNADLSLNFKLAAFDLRPGVPWQDPILGFADGIYTNTRIGNEVIFNLPITKTITNKNLDSIIFTISVVAQEYPTEGGVRSAPIAFKVWVRQGNGAWELRHNIALNEVFASATPFEFNCPVNNYGGTQSQFQVRVERVTPTDTDTTRFQRAVQWVTYQEVIETKLRYPSLALFAARFDRAQFDSVGEISARIKARTCAIPSNAIVADDGGLVFSGLWNGTFYTPAKATRCPAMQLYDLMTNTRYGLGKRIKQSGAEKSSFYVVSQYCNGIVPNGKGGIERRFQCDIMLDSKEDAKRIIDMFRTIFRGFAYYLDGAIRIGADMPSTGIAHQFSAADVEGGLFEYSDQVGLKGLNTRALVWWNDPENSFERTPEYVEDRDGIALYGLNEIEISVPGCTTQGQAHRAGLAALLGDRVRDTAVTFRSRLKGVMVLPGDEIQIADSKQANEEIGGLVSSSDGTTTVLDRPVKLASGVSYILFCTMPDGTIQERTVTSNPGNRSTLTTAPAYGAAPLAESTWVLASVLVTPQKFQVTNIVPVEGSSYSIYEIQAVIYEPSFYAAVEQGLSLVTRSTRITAPTVVSVPRDVAAIPRIISNQSILSVSWQFAAGADGTRDEFVESYVLEWKRGNTDDWGNTRSVSGLGYEMTNPIEDVYTFRVASVDTSGRRSAWVESNPALVTSINTYAFFSAAQTSMFAMDY